MTKRVIVFGVAVGVFCGACTLIPLVGTESYYEQKIPAELMLKDYAAGGVLVFVDETGAGRTEQGLRPPLAEMVGRYLVEKARIKSKNLLSQDKLSQLRDERQDFSSLSPVQLGRAGGASLVLYILITDYDVYGMGEQEYYGGSLVTRSILFDVVSGRALWPRAGSGRVVDVEVEIETGGRAATLERLITATGHCITRSFYNCPRPEYRSADEKLDYISEQW